MSGRLRWFVAGALVLALGATGCSDDDGRGDDAASTTTSSSSTTTSSTTASTTSTTAAPSTSTTAPAFPDDAEAYTSELVRAWGVGDRATAELYASPEAVDVMFSFADPGGPRWDLEQCEGAAGTTYCTFVDPERATALDLAVPVADDPDGRIDHPHEVARAEFQPA